MRVLTVTDLHQRRGLYQQIRVAVEIHKPDLVAVVGDFIDQDLPSDDPELLPLNEAALELAGITGEVVFVRGNHEDMKWPLFERTWLEAGRELHALHGSAATFGPLVVVGFPCGMGRDIFYGTNGRRLDDYSPDKWLAPIMDRTGAPGRTLWIMHEPPSRKLAETFFTSGEWSQAVKDYQPLVTVSGHDHNTPLKSGCWHTRIGRTISINLGQRVHPPGKLLYCILDFSFPGDQPCFPRKFSFKRFG
jgi:Icc-related predicted phosphoesterase